MGSNEDAKVVSQLMGEAQVAIIDCKVSSEAYRRYKLGQRS